MGLGNERSVRWLALQKSVAGKVDPWPLAGRRDLMPDGDPVGARRIRLIPVGEAENGQDDGGAPRSGGHGVPVQGWR